MEERRKNKRWLLNTYFDAYRENREASPSYLADISKDGLLLISRHPVQTNIVVPLRISLNKEVTPDGELRVSSRVVRCNKDRDFNYYNTGCKLVDLSSSSVETIERIIEMYRIT
jgi:PilZ domain